MMFSIILCSIYQVFQQLERLSRNQRVAGSNPAAPTIGKPRNQLSNAALRGSSLIPVRDKIRENGGNSSARPQVQGSMRIRRSDCPAVSLPRSNRCWAAPTGRPRRMARSRSKPLRTSTPTILGPPTISAVFRLRSSDLLWHLPKHFRPMAIIVQECFHEKAAHPANDGAPSAAVVTWSVLFSHASTSPFIFHRQSLR